MKDSAWPYIIGSYVINFILLKMGVIDLGGDRDMTAAEVHGIFWLLSPISLPMLIAGWLLKHLVLFAVSLF